MKLILRSRGVRATRGGNLHTVSAHCMVELEGVSDDLAAVLVKRFHVAQTQIILDFAAENRAEIVSNLTSSWQKDS